MNSSKASFDDIHAWAGDSLAAGTGAEAQACDAQIAAALTSFFAPPVDGALPGSHRDDTSMRRAQGDALVHLFAAAPSADVYRHLWRILARSERDGALGRASLVRLFAIPVVVVAALEPATAGPRTLPGVATNAAALTALLVEHGALAGNRTLALSSALVDAAAIDLARLPPLFSTVVLDLPQPHAAPDPPQSHAAPDPPQLRVAPDPPQRHAALDLPQRRATQPDLAPAPIVVSSTTESVHLRFLVGTALAAPGADLFAHGEPGRWAMPFAQELGSMLAAPGTVVLAMPRAPQPLVEALWHGRMAQREVSAQLFASNALRGLRARVGEPVAVISVHRGPVDDAPAEVRVSISSPLEPRDAQGLRCPLWPLDRPDDVVTMLATLLADCRVSDVRRMPGVHADRDPVTGGPLLFKADAAGASPRIDEVFRH